MLSLEGAVTCAVVRNPNSLCVTFVIGKVSTGMASRCGESDKNASDPVSKTATAATASKTWFTKLPSGVSLLYPKQCIAMETVPCDHPVIFHEFCLCTAVGQVRCSCTKLFLLVMLCLVFVGECIGKVGLINFKWLSKNILPTLVIWLESLAKFVVAVVGQVTLLSTDAALESRLTSRQVQGTLLQSQIYFNRWHRIM